MLTWEELKGLEIDTSDVHVGHYEWDRVAKNGLIPRREWLRFRDWTSRNACPVIVNGDFVDCCALLPEALKTIDDVELPENINVGNHDRRNKWISQLHCCSDQPVYVNSICRLHGHQADPVWNKPTDRRLWAGEQITRIGHQIQGIHPDADEWVLRPLRWVNRRVLPKGKRIHRDRYLMLAAKLAHEESRCEVVTHGHDHEPGVFLLRLTEIVNPLFASRPMTECPIPDTILTEVEVYERGEWRVLMAMTDEEVEAFGIKLPRDPPYRKRLVTVADTGTWLPAMEAHPLGWYKHGEVAPHVWIQAKRHLYRVYPEGLREVA